MSKLKKILKGFLFCLKNDASAISGNLAEARECRLYFVASLHLANFAEKMTIWRSRYFFRGKTARQLKRATNFSLFVIFLLSKLILGIIQKY